MDHVMRRILLALAAALLGLLPATAQNRVLPSAQIDGSGNVRFPNGPVIGQFTDGTFKPRGDSPVFTGTTTLPIMALTGAPGMLKLGQQTPVQGGNMRVDWSIDDGVNPIHVDGGIWPANKTYSYFGIGRTFDATTVPGSGTGDAPVATLYVKAVNAGAGQAVDGIIINTVGTVPGANVFAGNSLVRAEVAGVKMRGWEFDIQPAIGATPASGSFGVGINAFNEPIPGAAILIGGVNGGTFSNGITLNGISIAGAGVAPESGTQMGALINTGSDVDYTLDAIIVQDPHKIKIGNSFVYGSGNDGVVMVPTNFVVKRTSDGNNVFYVTQAGDAVVTGLFRESFTTSPASNATCTTGMRTWDANYEYRCVATNTWKRAALSSY